MQRTFASLALLAISTFMLPAGAAPGDANGKAESQLVSELNRDRQQHGLPNLRLDDRLTQVAREHSQRMADARALSHQFSGEEKVSTRIAAAGLRFSRSGENVGMNTSLEGVQPEFMESPPHRANILHPQYNAVGIGVVEKDGAYWVTQDFAAETEALSPADAARSAATAFNQLRRKRGVPSLETRRIPDLRNMACAMAQQERLDTRGALRVTNSRYVVVYTQNEPADLPDSARDLTTHRDIRSFAVGACFARDDKNPGGVYWIVMVFF